MAKSRTKKGSVSAEPTTRRGQVPAVFILLVALVAIAVLLFEGRASSPRYAVDFERAINEATEGHPEAETIRNSLRSLVEPVFKNASLLGSELTSKLSEVLDSSPWIKTVRGVRRVFPSGVELDLEIRRPYAELQIGSRYFLVDHDGEVLPEILDEPRGFPLKRLTLAPGGDENRPLGTWEDAWLRAAVRAGVQLFKDIESVEPEEREILNEVGFIAVDISNHEFRLDRRTAELSLVTSQIRIESGTGHARPFLVRWGRATNHHRAAIEVSVLRKLRNLQDIWMQRSGAFEGLDEVDVWLDDPIWSDRN